MARQDVDPLADTAPPRHAYESDDEDEIEYTTSTRYEGDEDHEIEHEVEHHDGDVSDAGVDEHTLADKRSIQQLRHRSLSNVKLPVEVDVVDVRIDDFDSAESPYDDTITYDPDAPSPITPSSPVPPERPLPGDGKGSGSRTVSEAYGPGQYLTVSRARAVSLGGRGPIPLVVASGRVGKTWAQGASLGEQVGQVVVEDVQVGLLFRPSWARIHVLISEVGNSLSPKTSYAYAEAVLLHIRPTSVLFLDSYNSSSYITGNPHAPHDAPLRVLRTVPSVSPPLSNSGHPTPSAFDKAVSDANVQPFDAPNLQTGTLAAFLSMLSLPRWSWSSNPTPPAEEKGETGKATAVLVPSAADGEAYQLSTFMPALHLIVTAFASSDDLSSAQWRDSDGKTTITLKAPQVTVSRNDAGATADTSGVKHVAEKHDMGSMYL